MYLIERKTQRGRRAMLASTLALVTACALLGAGLPLPHRSVAAETIIVAAPVIPSRTFTVTEYGAVGDGKTKNTAALQKAIDACGKAGGGTVRVPAGRYLTGPLHFVSNMELRIEKGATLLLSDDRADFTLTDNRYEDGFTAKNCHDIALTGEGTIDGQGAAWWARFDKKDTTAPHRPFLVTLTNCQRVAVLGITLTNSPMFHLVPQKCQDVTIDGIRITAPEKAPNTDGIDPSGWRFHITHCVIDTGDDNIAVKPSGQIDPNQPAVKDFLIENCTFLNGHGMSVGGQTPGGLDGMTVRDCTFRDTDAGIRLKASRGAGGLVQNCVYENLTMTNVKVAVLITSFYNGNSPTASKVDPAQEPAMPVTDKTPIWRHIQIRNVTATGSAVAGQIYGLAEMPVEDVTFSHVTLAGRKGVEIIHAKNISFTDSKVTAQVGAPVVLEHADVQGIDRSGLPPTPPKAAVRAFDVRDYGAVADGTTKNTEAIARAIAACAAAGGGRVVFPPGTYLTGPIRLASNLDLHVERGATVLFSRDHDDYPLIVTHFEGLPTVRCHSPLYGENLRNVAITGPGVFDAQGETWRPLKRTKAPEAVWNERVAAGGFVDEGTKIWWPSKAARDGEAGVKALLAGPGATDPEAYRPYRDYLRPTLLELVHCDGILLDGPTFQNSPAWNLHLLLSDHITVRNVTALNPWWAQNGDGIDLDSCRHVVLEHSVFNVGDDGICLKSGKDAAGRKLGRPTENVTVRNCTVYRAHGGVTVGSEMSGGVRDVAVADCVFTGTDIGLRFKSTRGRGGMVENVSAHNIDMANIGGAAISFDMYYQNTPPVTRANGDTAAAAAVTGTVDEGTPRFRGFAIRDVRCDGAQSALIVRGLPEMPVENLTLEKVRIRADNGVSLLDARDIVLRDVQLTTPAHNPLVQERVQGLKLERVEGLGTAPAPEKVASGTE